MQTESRDASLLASSAEVLFINAKIMQTESRTSSLLERYAEVQFILCKDNANKSICLQ